jgi:hypothetical protein
MDKFYLANQLWISALFSLSYSCWVWVIYFRGLGMCFSYFCTAFVILVAVAIISDKINFSLYIELISLSF